MQKRNVFYSFHYDNDVFRVQQIRNMGVIYGNEPVIKNEWENIKRGGDTSIRRWILNEMSKCSCVVVLIGQETYKRQWVYYEIQQAWAQGKGLLGIYIHNLKDPNTGTCSKGFNPFDLVTVHYQGRIYKLSQLIRCIDPNSDDAYNDIYTNLACWVEDAIAYRYRIAGYRL